MEKNLSATFRLIVADLRRKVVVEGRQPTATAMAMTALRPGPFSVVVYRIGSWLHNRGHRRMAMLMQGFQFVYTGNEIQYGSIIGPGLVAPDCSGLGISAFNTIGRNCTFLGRATTTIGAVPGADAESWRMVIGDNCVVGPGARIVGPIRLADCTQIKPNAVVLVSSTVPGAILSGIPARRRGVMAVEDVARWKPLEPRFEQDHSVRNPVTAGLPT